MKLERWALIAEIVSGLAIVTTLIVLIVETQANTEAIQISNRQSLAERGEQYMLARLTSPELATIVEKRSRGEALSVAELWIYRGYLGAVMRVTEESFLLYEDGRLDEAYWNRNAAAFGAVFANSVARNSFAYWGSIHAFTPEFGVWGTNYLTEMWGDAGSAEPLIDTGLPDGAEILKD